MSFNEFGHRELWKGEALVKADCLPFEPSWLPMVPEKLLLQEQRCVVLQAVSPTCALPEGLLHKVQSGKERAPLQQNL